MTGNMEPGTGNRGFRLLKAWERADDLASLIFRSVNDFPSQHRWLGLQMSRAAVSVPANIAEGYGRGSLADYLRFLDIARGSLSEVEYYIHFVQQQSLLPAETVETLDILRADTGKLLHGLWMSLKQKASSTWDHSGSAIREFSEEYEVPD